MILELGKKYAFNMPSTKKVEVKKTVEHYIQFFEDRLVYVGNYKAIYIDEEDEEHGYKKDIEREHKWMDVIKKQNLIRVHRYRWFDENLFAVKLFCWGCEDMIFCFYNEAAAEKIFTVIMEYIFGEISTPQTDLKS